MLLCSIKYLFFPCVFVSVMSSQWVSNPTHTQVVPLQADYLSSLLSSLLVPAAHPKSLCLFFFPFFHVDEFEEPPDWFVAKRWTYLFPFVWKIFYLSLSITLSVCLFDWQGLWDETGVTPSPPPPSFCPQTILPQIRSLCAFFWPPRNYWVWKGTSSSPVPPVRS